MNSSEIKSYHIKVGQDRQTEGKEPKKWHNNQRPIHSCTHTPRSTIKTLTWKPYKGPGADLCRPVQAPLVCEFM